MGSVTVIGTSTMSTFMRIKRAGAGLGGRGAGDGRGFGSGRRAGGRGAGAVVDGGGTWTLLRGSSCALRPGREAQRCNAQMQKHSAGMTGWTGLPLQSAVERRME